MAETVTSLFGGHRPPADRPPASWPPVQPVACLQSFGYATLTSSAPSSSTGPARRDTDDSLTSYLRRCRHSYRLRNRRSRPFNASIRPIGLSPSLRTRANQTLNDLELFAWLSLRQRGVGLVNSCPKLPGARLLPPPPLFYPRSE